MRHSAGYLAVTLLVLLAGCTGTSSSTRSWVIANGGLDGGVRQERVGRAAAALLEGMQPRVVAVRVLDTSAVGAYAWPDGQIYLTRGLVDQLEDDEIAAAVAHELGHLFLHGHARDVASLSGGAGGHCEESAADAKGVALLKSRQIPAHAMARMLTKVAASPQLSPGTRRMLRQRIARLP